MSRDGTYATIGFPRQASFDVTAEQPAAFLASMVSAALRQGMPARRTAGPLLAWIGRRDLPSGAITAGLRRLPRRPAPDLDAVVSGVAAAWSELSELSRHLPAEPPRLSALAVQRSAARTIFLFGEHSWPLVVVKQPRGMSAGVRTEAAALDTARPAEVAPRLLGWLGGAAAQEGLPGRPYQVEPVGLDAAPMLRWTRELDQLGSALCRLSAATARRHDPTERLLHPLDVVLSHDVAGIDRRLVAAARSDLARLDVVVLQHADLSAQNWLVSEKGLEGLVDWELANALGVPGFDMWHAAVALLEHGVGLRRWSESLVSVAFAAAWDSAPLFTQARRKARSAAQAAGVPDDLLDSLEVAYFARRLGRRLGDPTGQGVGSAAATDMLAVACAS